MMEIAGFINAVRPFCGDHENLTAFRFYALNPIVDPWVFIICRKSVFRHLRALLSCRFSKGAGEKTPAHYAVSVPLEGDMRCNSSHMRQSSYYPGLPASSSRSSPPCK